MTRIPKVFLSEMFGELRVICEDNKFFFCAIDVCKALGYTNITRELNIHCRQDGIKSGRVEELGFLALSNSSPRETYIDSSAAPTSRRLSSSKTGSLMNCFPPSVRPAGM